ncbi:hypothetical protein HDU67_000163, partial [Dinochytrium kinnereticum]
EDAQHLNDPHTPSRNLWVVVGCTTKTSKESFSIRSGGKSSMVRITALVDLDSSSNGGFQPLNLIQTPQAS